MCMPRARWGYSNTYEQALQSAFGFIEQSAINPTHGTYNQNKVIQLS